MLSQDEENYLQKIPSDKVVIIKPYNPYIEDVANGIISKIKNQFPKLEVVHMGAAGLGISGQGDIDIYCLSRSAKFIAYVPEIAKLFGEPKSKKEDSIGWEFLVDDFPIELYLTDPDSKTMKRQLRVFDTLKGDQELLREYEDMKSLMNGKSFREYQRKKYEFYHKILN